jgi:futalosine hydrolase
MVSTLLLVPTRIELEFLSSAFHQRIAEFDCKIALCGFGPILAGILASQLISEHKPTKVLLLGVAGGLTEELPVAKSLEFDEVVCYGVGAGSGNRFVTTQEMGWCHWRSEHDGFEIRDSISVDNLRENPVKRDSPAQLLTCCAASASDEDVQLRLAKFPNAIAEDMEGFAVAAACLTHKTPLRIIRGISNRAGDRNKSHWRIHEAMAAAEVKALEALRT